MDFISYDDLLSLINQKNNLSLSIYIPTEVSGTETLQNSIRFKNILRNLKNEYSSEIYIDKGLKDLINDAKVYKDNYEFWQHQSNCLAMFISRDFLKYYRLNIDCDEFFHVGIDYYILPLISYLNSYTDFYILNLSRKGISVYESNKFSLSELEIEQLSLLVNDELQNRQFQKQTQFFTGSGEGGRKDPRFYGTGAKDIKLDKYLINFFNKVDKVINKTLKRNKPIILSGVDYLFPLYIKANSFPLVMNEYIHGNLNDLNKKEILSKANEILDSIHNKETAEKINRIKELKISKDATYSSDLEVIVNASNNKQIDELFIFTDKKYWGNYNFNKNKIDIKNKNDFGAEELINKSAINTLLNGGKVYVYKPGEYDTDKPYAAILR